MAPLPPGARPGGAPRRIAPAVLEEDPHLVGDDPGEEGGSDDEALKQAREWQWGSSASRLPPSVAVERAQTIQVPDINKARVPCRDRIARFGTTRRARYLFSLTFRS